MNTSKALTNSRHPDQKLINTNRRLNICYLGNRLSQCTVRTSVINSTLMQSRKQVNFEQCSGKGAPMRQLACSGLSARIVLNAEGLAGRFENATSSLWRCW